MPAPVFSGDTLVLGIGDSWTSARSIRAGRTAGSSPYKTRAYNQRGELVMEYERKSMADQEGHGRHTRLRQHRVGRGIGRGDHPSFRLDESRLYLLVRSRWPSSSARLISISSGHRAFTSPNTELNADERATLEWPPIHGVLKIARPPSFLPIVCRYPSPYWVLARIPVNSAHPKCICLLDSACAMASRALNRGLKWFHEAGDECVPTPGSTRRRGY